MGVTGKQCGAVIALAAAFVMAAGIGVHKYNQQNTNGFAEDNLPACKAHFAGAVANPEELCLQSARALVTGEDASGMLYKDMLLGDNPPALLFKNPPAEALVKSQEPTGPTLPFLVLAPKEPKATYDPVAHAFTVDMAEALAEQRQALEGLVFGLSELDKRGFSGKHKLEYYGQREIVARPVAAPGR